MKYISFIITIGGDTGWRFSNGPEWNSGETRLLFDADLWTPERIQTAMKTIYAQYSEESCYCSTLWEKLEHGEKFIVPFINNNEGVYSNPDYSYNNLFNENIKDLNESKVKRNVSNDDITPWELNGSSRCRYY